MLPTSPYHRNLECRTNSEASLFLLNQGRYERAHDCGTQAVEAAEYCDSEFLTKTQIYLDIVRAWGFSRTGQIPEARKLAFNLFYAGRDIDDPAILGHAHRILGSTQRATDINAALSHTMMAADLFSRSGDVYKWAEATITVAWLEVRRGKPDAAIRILDEESSVVDVVTREHPSLTAKLRQALASAFSMMERYDESLVEIHAAIEASRQSANPFVLANSLTELGEIYRLLEDYEKADEAYRDAQETFETLDDRMAVVIALNRAMNALGLRDYEYAAQIVESIMDDPRVDELELRGFVALVRGFICGVRDELHEATQALDRVEQTVQSPDRDVEWVCRLLAEAAPNEELRKRSGSIALRYSS